MHTDGEVYREGKDVAAVDDILHRLVVQLNFGGLEDNGEFGGAVWGYDLHTAICTSFRASAAQSLIHACESSKMQVEIPADVLQLLYNQKEQPLLYTAAAL